MYYYRLQSSFIHTFICLFLHNEGGVSLIELYGRKYELIENIHDAFDEEVFSERYSEILNKYDYIVGDWGYDQLRLKGFYEEDNKKASFDTKISMLDDYLYEYCNFGCAYFVLKRVDV